MSIISNALCTYYLIVYIHKLSDEDCSIVEMNRIYAIRYTGIRYLFFKKYEYFCNYFKPLKPLKHEQMRRNEVFSLGKASCKDIDSRSNLEIGPVHSSFFSV